MDIPGFTTDCLDAVEQLLYGELDWQKQFKTGKGPGPEKKGNYDTGLKDAKAPGSWKVGKGPGNMGKRKVNTESEGLSGVALPKGPGNPQAGSSEDVHGMRMLG